MRFKIGEKVRVTTYKYKPLTWNTVMFKLMEKTVTISKIRIFSEWPYQIAEDPRWVWREKDFISLKNEKNPNYLFMCREKK